MGSRGAELEKQGSPELLERELDKDQCCCFTTYILLWFFAFLVFFPQTIPPALSVFLWSWGLGFPADSCSFKPTQMGLQPPQEREAGAIATAWIFFFSSFFKFLFFLSLHPEQIMQ